MSGLQVTTRAGRRVYRGAPKPLHDGACPHCARVIQLTPTGRRRHHIDPAIGARCTGSGIAVGDRVPVVLNEMPPILVADFPTDHHTSKALQQTTAVLAVDGKAVRYQGGSDRVPAHGRGECPSCHRHLPLNSDGTLRRHRVRHQDPLAPYCDGGES